MVKWMDAHEIEGHLNHHEWRFQDDQVALAQFGSRGCDDSGLYGDIVMILLDTIG